MASTWAVSASERSMKLTPLSASGLRIEGSGAAARLGIAPSRAAAPDLSVNQSIQARAAALFPERTLIACW